MIPVHISDNVQQCDIVPETADNSSDHLPISMTLNIQTPAGKSIEKRRSNLTSFPHGKWSNDRFKVQYCAKVKAALESWKPCEIEKVTSAEAGKVVSLSVWSQLRQKSSPMNPNAGIMTATWLKREIELSTIFGRNLIDPILA